MSDEKAQRELTSIERESQAFREALRLNEIEGCPLSDDDIAMFDMFHREGWSHERRREYIKKLAVQIGQTHAAE